MKQAAPALSGSFRALKSFARSPRAERCELCAAALAPRHQHLIDPSRRELICACDGCALLFDEGGATRYRRVPRQVRRLGGIVLPDESWEKFLIPINLAFVYRSSHAGKTVALYPSAAGVTESQLELGHWDVIARLREDVEALLVNRLKGRREHFIAPIDRCFELVGLVRRNWEGISGGDRVWEEVSGFFARLEEEAVA